MTAGLTVGRRLSNRGQVVVLFALSLVVFIGVTALVIDYGMGLVSRRDYQAAADAAALAGTHFLVPPDQQTCVQNDGRYCARLSAWKSLNANLNLAVSDSNLATYAGSDTSASGQVAGGFTVWIDTPPGNAGSAYPGSVGSSNDALFVKVSKPSPTTFARVLGITAFPVSAWATAGTFSGRFAVMTLRRGSGSTAIDNGPANATDIVLAGNTTQLTVLNGDVGGNWGMKLNANNLLTLKTDGSLPNYQPSIFLRDWMSCGSSCWNNSQIVDGNGASLASTYPPSGARELRGWIQDPQYAPPLTLAANAPASPVAGLPQETTNGDVNVSTGSVAGATCAAGSPRIGPGWYDDINVGSGKCLILDPTHLHSAPEATTGTPVPQANAPGIFYVTGNIAVGNNALIVGDGVTLIVRPNGTNNQFSPNGIVDLNTGKGLDALNNASGSKGQILGGWTTKAASPYVWDATSGMWIYASSQENNMATYGRGDALYVLKPSQYQTSPAPDANTAVVKVTSSGSGFAWSGVTYAPRDNVALAGQPQHNGFGQLISWTFTFNGGTNVTQTYDGPGNGYPVLIEPCTSGSGGAC